MTSEPGRGLPAVAVVGAGLMGHGIAQVFATAGASVRIWDPDPVTLASVPSRIAEHMAAIGATAACEVVLAESLEDAVESAELVVEAIPEVLAAKRELLARLDVLAPDAIIATNTSVLRITEIAEGSARPGRVVGTHWWNPPYLVPIVEVVRGNETDEAVAATVTDWLAAAGKLPVAVNWDAPGFIGNRMQFALWREALWIVEQGIADAETVDIVARNTFGARLAAIGPIESADFIGLGLSRAILDYLSPHLSTASSASPLINDAIEHGRLGAATGGGLLPWADGARSATEQRLIAHLVRLYGAGDQAG
jgi:3-hydroxybutyryl-CoA dehydrogenase